MIPHQEYLDWFNNQETPIGEILNQNCPLNRLYVIERMKKSFKTPEEAIRNIDFGALDLPLDPIDYTGDDWQAIGDHFDEILTGRIKDPMHDYHNGW